MAPCRSSSEGKNAADFRCLDGMAGEGGDWSPVADLTTGAAVAGYRIEAVLGHGSMGTVYSALDTALDRRVALKMLTPELCRDERFRERFLRESKIAASLLPARQELTRGSLLQSLPGPSSDARRDRPRLRRRRNRRRVLDA